MIFRNGCYFILMALLASCASQIPPDGGPKDITPPLVVKANPENLSTHFHSSKISITFNEYVQLNDPSTQVFFSPAIEGKINYRLHGKTLVISLPDTLKSNTTYTVNFGSAIKDIREGNTMLNYQYVFSTGAAIDSFRIAGRVKNVVDGKSKPNLLVMLYRDADDSAVAKRRPDYNARTDSSGNFILNHLAAGRYKLFALDDGDFNLKYNMPGESIAFYDSAISIHDTLGLYNLFLFKPESEKQSVLTAYSRQPGKAVIIFAKRTNHLEVRSLKDSLKILTEHNYRNDTITCWVNDVKSDSLAFLLSDDDYRDTVKVRMKTQESKIKTAPPRLQVTALAAFSKELAQLKKGQALVLGFSAPVISENEKRKLLMFEDTSRKAIELTPKFFVDTSTGKKLARIDYPFRDEVNYRILIPDSAFKDFTGNTNDTTRLQVKLFEAEDLGNLLIHFSFTDSLKATGYYYELHRKDGTLIALKALSPRRTNVEFTQLVPGDYSLKVIEDRNNNLQWESGDYWNHLQPEKIFFYPGAITLRANWDVEVTMKIDNR